MKYPQRMVKIIAVALLLGATIYSAAAQTTASVQSVSGKVEIQTPGGAWRGLSEGDEVSIGSKISTGFRSAAVLEIGSATLEVDQLTRMTLEELAEREGTVRTELFLRVGRVKAEVTQRQGLQQDFRLRSPVSTAAVRGTSFEYDGVNLKVLEGLVALANAYGQSVSVAGGEVVVAEAGELPPEGLAALEALFAVNTSASQIEEIIDSLPSPETLGIETGSVTINWELPQ